MWKFLLIVTMFLSLVACKSSKPGRDLIPPETFVPLLVDLHLVYSIQTAQKFRNLSREVDSVDTYSYVFEKHGVTKAIFDSTLAWYTRHPDQFTDIYDHVVMQLSQIADSLGVEQE
jgi:hypothetical protein